MLRTEPVGDTLAALDPRSLPTDIRHLRGRSCVHLNQGAVWFQCCERTPPLGQGGHGAARVLLGHVLVSFLSVAAVRGSVAALLAQGLPQAEEAVEERGEFGDDALLRGCPGAVG